MFLPTERSPPCNVLLFIWIAESNPDPRAAGDSRLLGISETSCGEHCVAGCITPLLGPTHSEHLSQLLSHSASSSQLHLHFKFRPSTQIFSYDILKWAHTLFFLISFVVFHSLRLVLISLRYCSPYPSLVFTPFIDFISWNFSFSQILFPRQALSLELWSHLENVLYPSTVLLQFVSHKWKHSFGMKIKVYF